ncbi:transglutaminase domain-containing protein, partial [Paenibacillus validus]|nr:transglutaminase domain-containing protein [Paenibacillus validus]
MGDTDLLRTAMSLNAVTLLIAAVFFFSVIQGLFRGASSSAKHLALMVTEGAVTLVSLFLAWMLTNGMSPKVQAWLVGLNITIPSEELGFWEQFYYTVVTGLRDFSLLRNSVLFVVGYGLIKQLVYRLIDPVVDGWLSARGDRLPRSGENGGAPTLFSGLLGGGI